MIIKSTESIFLIIILIWIILNKIIAPTVLTAPAIKSIPPVISVNTNGINTYSNQYEHTSDHQWENHPNQPLTVPIASRSDRVSSPLQHTHLSATPMETSKSLPNLSKSGSSSSKKTKKNIAESTSPTTLLGRSLSKRSRMGCLTCRSRKKRCCETKPKCTECARLKLNCVWPKPGTEHKNKPKDAKQDENTIDHEVYGTIKVLRGIVEYRSDA